MNIMWFVVAIASICIAHYIRIQRWKLFIDIYEKPDEKCLMHAMAVGYLLNSIFPLKLGDAARAWIAGRKMQSGMALGFSTVIIDRFLDVVCVGVIFLAFFIGNIGGESIYGTILFYLCLAVGFCCITVMPSTFRRRLKRILGAVARVFNPTIEISLLQFFWSLLWNFKDIFLRISRPKLVFSTISMWGGYLFSYYSYARFVNTLGIDMKWTDMFNMLFAQNELQMSTWSAIRLGGTVFQSYPLYLIAYMILPVLVLGAVSLSMKDEPMLSNTDENRLHLLPHINQQERLEFLEAYFSDSNREYLAEYLKINQKVSIIRDYSAGSNATTLLCMDNTKTFFRKYAFGNDGQKLFEQIRWIREYQDCLPLPEILEEEKTDIYCYYDMLYRPNAVGMFEYIHSMPLQQSWDLLKSVLSILEETIHSKERKGADLDIIDSYINTKFRKNLDIIKSNKKIRNLLQYDKLIINGTEYFNLRHFEKMLNKEYLEGIFQNDPYAVIHGDLTIENIICNRDELGEDRFYLIDPNTGNMHNSPYLDYAKLLQSLHGDYEFFMSAKNVAVNGNHIDFIFTRSSAYIELYTLFKEYLEQKFNRNAVRSIYYHEIGHWLRLMPYKINNDKNRIILFFAGMIMVMNDVADMFEDK